VAEASASAPRWRPGSRVARLRATRSFTIVLVPIVVSFLFASIAPDAPWTSAVLVLLESATLVLAMWTSGVARADSQASIGLIVVAIVAAVTVIVSGGSLLVGIVGILSGLLTLATVAVISIGVLDQGEVNTQSVGGAICIYILIGLVFLFVYSAIAALGDGNLFAQGTDGTRSIRLYFSFVTLATLGYGDYTPAGDLGRTVAAVEALFGQLYLVTVIALLVSRLGARRR
jgi:voltage-gated potassium channel